MQEHIDLRINLPASPKDIYDTWLDGKKHTLMTGAFATGSPKKGERYSAWDGYVTGINVELIPYQKIVQTWRTTDFGRDDKDSILEVHLDENENGCEVRLLHKGIPANQPDYIKDWKEFYFKPMKKHFKTTRF